MWTFPPFSYVVSSLTLQNSFIHIEAQVVIWTKHFTSFVKQCGDLRGGEDSVGI